MPRMFGDDLNARGLVNLVYLTGYGAGVRSVLRKVPVETCPEKWLNYPWPNAEHTLDSYWTEGYRAGATDAAKAKQSHNAARIRAMERVAEEG